MLSRLAGVVTFSLAACYLGEINLKQNETSKTLGIFDSNIHMNGAGTTYQSFLDLADEAEQKGGKIGDRTVRLVKAGDGLATTTSHGTTGARADQIGGALSGAVKAGDGAKLANEFFRFVATINSSITAQDEKDAINGSEDYTAFVTTSTDLLFALNPKIAEGVRNLDADAREKLFDAAGNAATAKSAEIQKLSEAGGNNNQELRMEAKHWSSASSCIMQLRQGA